MEVSIFSQAIQLIGGQTPNWRFTGPLSAAGGFQGKLSFKNKFDETIHLQTGIVSSKSAARVELAKAGLIEMFGAVPEYSAVKHLLYDQRICADGTKIYKNLYRFAQSVKSVKPEVVVEALKANACDTVPLKVGAVAASPLVSEKTTKLPLSTRIELAIKYAEECKRSSEHRKVQRLEGETGLTSLENFMLVLLREVKIKM